MHQQWSNLFQIFHSIDVGHAKGVDVAKALNALKNCGLQLPLNQFISLGSDCANVNKTIWNHINTHMTDEGLHGLF